MYNTLKSILPPLSKIIHDVHDTINLMDIKTNRTEKFLLYQMFKIYIGIIIFSCTYRKILIALF